jgi:hypothetical protein
MKLRRWTQAATALAVLALTGAGALSGSAATSASCWRGTTVNGAIRYCGPATARLSVFSGVTFKNGTCHRTTSNGTAALYLKMGRRSLKNPIQKGGTNGGLTYFDLSIIGPLSSPRGGGVIAFSKGKHWYGRGTSIHATASGGTFVAQGIAARGSHGTATGSFKC